MCAPELRNATGIDVTLRLSHYGSHSSHYSLRMLEVWREALRCAEDIRKRLLERARRVA